MARGYVRYRLEAVDIEESPLGRPASLIFTLFRVEEVSHVTGKSISFALS